MMGFYEVALENYNYYKVSTKDKRCNLIRVKECHLISAHALREVVQHFTTSIVILGSDCLSDLYDIAKVCIFLPADDIKYLQRFSQIYDFYKNPNKYENDFNVTEEDVSNAEAVMEDIMNLVSDWRNRL